MPLRNWDFLFLSSVFCFTIETFYDCRLAFTFNDFLLLLFCGWQQIRCEHVWMHKFKAFFMRFLNWLHNRPEKKSIEISLRLNEFFPCGLLTTLNFRANIKSIPVKYCQAFANKFPQIPLDIFKVFKDCSEPNFFSSA